MLVLSRKVGQFIMIGENIKVTVTEVDRGKVRLGIDAPRDTAIFRDDHLLPPDDQTVEVPA